MKNKKIILLLTLIIGISPIMKNSTINAEEIRTTSTIKDKHLDKLDFYIGSGPMMKFNSYTEFRAYLQREKVKNINSIVDKVVNLVRKGIRGTVKINKSGYISFTPCSSCPWPSLGTSY